MSKKFILFVVTLIIVVSYLFSFEKILVNKIYMLNSSISSAYIKLFIYSTETINKYFNQLDYIEQLKESNEMNLQYKSMYEKKVQEIGELNNALSLNLDKEIKYEKVKVLAYYSFNNHSKVLIDKDDIVSDKIYPLITFDGFSAGIVLTKNEKSVAYLNENKKCNYTVFIGENDTPGITSGVNDDGNIIIKYVPIWKEIQMGDEVITSSMDSIFPYGVKVGNVVDIKVYENTKEVFVKPYAKTLGMRNFFITHDTNSSI
jgi:rod shape-determining protein MreC